MRSAIRIQGNELFVSFIVLLLSTVRSEKALHPSGCLKTDNSDKIIDGIEAGRTAHPHLVYITNSELSNQGSFATAGVIIDAYTILSLARGSLPSAGNILEPMVYAGKHNRSVHENSQQSRSVCRYKEYPKWSGGAINCYAVIHLSEPLTFNDYVKPTSLPDPTAKVEGLKCIVHGWAIGFNRNDVVMETNVQVLNSKDCSFTDASVLCVSRGACRFDYSPLMCDIGDVSTAVGVFQLVDSPTGNCKSNGIYTNFITLDRDWLTKEIEEAKKQCRLPML